MYSESKITNKGGEERKEWGEDIRHSEEAENRSMYCESEKCKWEICSSM